MPASSWRATAWRTAASASRASAAASIASPRSRRTSRSRSAGGRGRLPVWVVRIRDSLRVIGARAPERSLLVAVRSLHAAFHAGRAGALLVALLGVWLVVEGATGLWLYGASVTRRPRAPGRAVHRVVGACSLAVGAIVGLT